MQFANILVSGSSQLSLVGKAHGVVQDLQFQRLLNHRIKVFIGVVRVLKVSDHGLPSTLEGILPNLWRLVLMRNWAL